MRAKTKVWLNISVAIFMLIGIGILLYYLPCPSSTQYLYFRVVLALAAAAFSAILLGFIQVTTVVKPNVIRAGGAFAVLILVLRYTPDLVDTTSRCAAVKDYTFFLRAPDNSTIPGLTGAVSLLVGNDIREEEINDKGIAYFRDVTSAFLEDKVTVEVKTKGWWLDKTHSVAIDTILSGSKMMLFVSQDESLCCIEGRIMDSNNIHRPISGATVFIADTSLVTDANGRFSIYIPQKRRKPRHTASITARGYTPYTTEIPLNNKEPFPVYLEKERQ